jgi:hypothetical protein
MVEPPADGPTSWFRSITDPQDSPKVCIDYLFLYSRGAEKRFAVRSCCCFLDRPFPVPASTPSGWLWASDHVGVVCELLVE